MSCHPVALVLSLVALAAPAQAMLVASYTASADSELSPNAGVPAGITASTLAGGTGLTRVPGVFRFDGFDSNTGLPEAFADGEFWEWTLDVTGPVTLDLTTLGVAFDRPSGGPSGYGLEATLNGGAPISVVSGSMSASSTFFPSISLASVPTLAAGDSLQFRLAAWAPGASDTLGLRNVSGFGDAALTIDGLVLAAIPEPSAALFGSLLAAGLCATAARRG